MKLYHYVHCPFCIRVRMVLGHLGLEYDSIVLAYDDEKTPIALTGKKMLPIMEIEGRNLNESLEIIKLLDQSNSLKTLECISNYQSIELGLNKLGEDIHSLAMPYFIWTPEFNEHSRLYFQKKKEIKRGPFSQLVHNRKKFETSLNQTLRELENIFDKEITKENIDLTDILFASHLWAMYIVPEYQFPEHIHQFLQAVKVACNFDYHGLYWRE